MGALGKCCDSRNLLSRHQNPAPELGQRQHETVTETLCEVAGANAMRQRTNWRLSFSASPLAEAEFASIRRLPYGAKKGETS
jgi:hypothetical protein